MKPEEWQVFYRDICLDLNIDPARDAESALVLSDILGKGSSLSLLDKYRGGTFCVVGNGPNLEQALPKIGDGKVIVADSALGIYVKDNPAPDIVVTDLDGDMKLLKRAFDSGSLMMIHAHGDNIALIREYAGYFRARAIGTTQNAPLWNIFNFFGFTDGDRGAFIANFLGAESINLAGFDFTSVGQKPGVNVERKLKKLKWAKILLEFLADERNTKLGEGPFITL